MFSDSYGSYCAIAFNCDEVISLIMSNTCIMQPWLTQQHGIIGIQNIVFHYHECRNVRNPMNVHFEVLDESSWFGDGLIHHLECVRC
jgi:hypothetical protein